jgi:hypothetical protein
MIPYRTRQMLKRLLIGLTILLLFAVVLGMCWFLWLQRYVVYTDDGAKLDFDMSLQFPDGEIARPPEPGVNADMIFGDDTDATAPVFKEMGKLNGYYVSMDALEADFSGVSEQIFSLPAGSAVMLEVKNSQGEFAYSSDLGPNMEGLDPTKVEALIKKVLTSGYYAVASFPAFYDSAYFEADPARKENGFLQDGGNGNLWYDRTNKCHWLNPKKDGTRTFVIQITTEIRELGFHEVVYTDFRIHKTSMIRFNGDKLKCLNETADLLVKTCGTDTFTVSFVREELGLTLPEGRTRLYLNGTTAADAANLSAQSGFADPTIKLVFLAETNDTRFDAYSVLRPIEMAQ